MTVISSELVKQAINARIEALFHIDPKTKEVVPYVCLTCDVLLKPHEVMTIRENKLKEVSNVLEITDKNAFNAVGNDSLEQEYKYPVNKAGARKWMKHMMLSPRGLYIDCNHEKKKDGKGKRRKSMAHVICGTCRHALYQCKMPRYAIANNMYCGRTPACFMRLSHCELTYLHPVKKRGFIISFTGGKCLRGSMSYYSVDMDEVVKGIAQLNALGAKTVILINGNMTAWQLNKAREHSAMVVEKLVDCLVWLRKNNREFTDEDVMEWTEYFETQKPIIIDRSSIVEESEDVRESNIQRTEEFSVYFPDGSINDINGGQGSSDEFKSLVEQAKQAGYDMNFQCDLQRRSVSNETEDKVFVLANLFQFPYGRGGMNEERLINGNELSDKLDVDEYVEHLSRLSLPQFHRPLFTLMLYNLELQRYMLRNSRLMLSNGMTPEMLMKSLNPEDVQRTLWARAGNVFLVPQQVNNSQKRLMQFRQVFHIQTKQQNVQGE